jgi:ATP-dependent DNA helicase RecQ
MEIQTTYDLPSNIRHEILERDSFKCRECGSTENLEVHHIFPKQFKVDHAPQNLITLCRTCHATKTPETQASFFSKIILLFKQQTDKILRLFNALPDERYQYVLNYLKIPGFRPYQKQIIDHLMNNRNVLVVMPTGSGKSLCYWLPGLLKANHTLVISPLKSLMYDQTQKMMTSHINATYVNSSLRADEKKKRLEMITRGLFKFVAVAPERFMNDYNNYSFNANDPLLSLKYSLLAIDEAHCIDKWGRKFRPAYSLLKNVREQTGKPTTVALTASASKKAQQKIIRSLALENCVTIVTGFYRSNIHLSVINLGKGFKNKYYYLREILNRNEGKKTIIYVLTIKEGNELAQKLKRDKYDVELYHSQIAEKEKTRIQNQLSGLIKPEINILISTSAFGMGVDIRDIRCVIHHSMPSNIEDYYQQFGRAGRDGDPAEAILLYQHGDEKANQFMNDLQISSRPRSEEEKERIKLSEKYELETMLGYIRSANKWKYITDYFGERKESKSIFILLLLLCLLLLLIVCALIILYTLFRVF